MFELGDFSEVAPHGKFKAFLDFFFFSFICCNHLLQMKH